MYRLSSLLVIMLLCLASGLVFAQEIPPMEPPTQPLVSCTEDAVAPCDMIATQSEDIVGIWTVYFNAEPAFIRYNADGTWLIADTVEHTNAVSVEGYPYGTFSFDEEDVFTSFDPNTPVEIMPDECREGRYLLRVIKVGGQPAALNKAVLDDCFPPRRTDWAYTLLWAAPVNP
jgi:hypothetical protein